MAGGTAHGPVAGPARGPGGGGVPDGLLIGLLAVLLIGTVLTWTAAGLAGLLSHGAWPAGLSFARTPLALRELVAAPADLAAAWPDADPATLSGPGLFWGLLVGEAMVAGVVALAALTALARRRTRRRARTAARQLAEGAPATDAPGPQATTDGTATRPPPAGPRSSAHQTVAETPPAITAHSSSAPPAPPELTKPPPRPVASVIAEPPLPGAAGGLYLRRDADPATVLATAEGAAVVVTADPGLWATTVGARAKLGPTHVYDPTHRTDAPERLRWAPEHGCAHPGTARARATALLAPVRGPAAADGAVHDLAVTMLRCCLQAAAVSGKPFRQVRRWATGTGTADAVRVLRRTPEAPGAAGELEAALTAHPERRDAATALLRHAFAGFGQPHLRDACSAARNDSVALESFAAELGTLYVVGEPIEAPRRQAGAMPFLTALTESVVEHGRGMAERSSSGRLDPPITLVLDDPAAVAPLPALPALLMAGPDAGLHTHAYLRSAAQTHVWWPELADTHLGAPRPPR
ncbi:type VI secretion protein [Streptomyces sp. TRM70308]|uniref:type VI secretion protein n=1 Tax=Streptomyces sp. TRM70308 TaxID=3131932 RepID=UPI003CFEB819